MEKIELIQTNDFFARYLFANVGHEDILLHFVNAIREDANEPPFESIRLEDPFNIKENIRERQTIVDAKAKTSTNELVMVEVQNIGNVRYISRILAYLAINYIKPLNVDLKKLSEGKRARLDYTLLTPVISISILDFIIRPNNPKTHTIHRMVDIETGEELTRDLEVHLVELPKLLNAKSNDLMLWLKFFTSKNLEEEKPMITKEAPIFERVFDCYDRFKGDEKLMEAYREGRAYMLSQSDMLLQERKEGREEGREEGEHNRNIAIAKNLLDMNMPIESIAIATGLSHAEIEALR